jgi:hypothetical protein
MRVSVLLKNSEHFKERMENDEPLNVHPFFVE